MRTRESPLTLREWLAGYPGPPRYGLPGGVSVRQYRSRALRLARIAVAAMAVLAWLVAALTAGAVLR